MNAPGMPASRRRSNHVCMRLKYGRACSGVFVMGITAMRPSTRRFSSLEASRTKASRSSSITPPRWGSRAMLTSTRQGITRPRAPARLSISSASAMRSSDCTRATLSKVYFTLFVCNCPINSTEKPGFNAGNFSSSSCTRFSPSFRMPAAQTALAVSALCVLVTAMISTGPRATFSIALWQARTFSRILCASILPPPIAAARADRRRGFPPQAAVQARSDRRWRALPRG